MVKLNGVQLKSLGKKLRYRDVNLITLKSINCISFESRPDTMHYK